MVNQDVLAYIRSQIALGVSRDAIKKALAIGGWNDADMAEAFAAIDGPPVPPAPAKPLAPKADVPSVAPPITTPRPMMPSTPMTSTPMQNTVRPVPSMSTISSAPGPKRHRLWPWMLILILLIVAGIAALAYLLYPSVVARYVPWLAPQQSAPVQQPTNPEPFIPFPDSDADMAPQETASSSAATTTDENGVPSEASTTDDTAAPPAL